MTVSLTGLNNPKWSSSFLVFLLKEISNFKYAVLCYQNYYQIKHKVNIL